MNLNDTIINELVAYNKELQINTMMELCIRNKSSQLSENIKNNAYENLNVFSKGLERLNTWKQLLQDNSILYFSKIITPTTEEDKKLMHNINTKINYLKYNNKHLYCFLFASLIIIFQIFGDGNHRTAQYFMKIMGYPKINYIQMNEIDNILFKNDYFIINKYPIKKMNDIINNLIDVYLLINC